MMDSDVMSHTPTLTMTQAQRAEATAIIYRSFDKIKAIYPTELKDTPYPNVVFELKGTVGGWANAREWKINLNSGLYVRNETDYKEEICQHEACHLLRNKLFPHAIRANGKRAVHGFEWKGLMRLLGIQRPQRCHQFDSSETRVQKDNLEAWKCNACDKVYYFKREGRRHQMLLKDPMWVWCRGHKGAGLTHMPKAQSAIVAPKTTIWTPAGTGSKMDQCVVLFKKYAGASRKALINLFVVQVGCTPAGASTYYYNCTKLQQQGKI